MSTRSSGLHIKPFDAAFPSASPAISERCAREPLRTITAEDILMGSDNYKSIPDDDPAYDAETGVYMTFLAEDE